jgi:hypothetical protein
MFSLLNIVPLNFGLCAAQQKPFAKPRAHWLLNHPRPFNVKLVSNLVVADMIYSPHISGNNISIPPLFFLPTTAFSHPQRAVRASIWCGVIYLLLNILPSFLSVDQNTECLRLRLFGKAINVASPVTSWTFVDSKGWTSLGWAVARGHEAVVRDIEASRGVQGQMSRNTKKVRLYPCFLYDCENLLYYPVYITHYSQR